MELWEKYEEELQKRYADRKESELEKISERIDEQLISWGEEYGERLERLHGLHGAAKDNAVKKAVKEEKARRMHEAEKEINAECEELISKEVEEYKAESNK